MSRRNRLAGIFCLLGPALFHGGALRAEAEDIEVHIKAAYLLNFARFVEWPIAVPGTEPVVIGILGHDSIAAALESTVRGKKINGRPIRIVEFPSSGRINRCDILFVPRSESKRARPALVDLVGKPVLVVGDARGFLNEGGTIEFQVVDDTLRFSINVRSADRAGLKISSELLGVAYLITGRTK
jgi:YfiR/HmsC-like